MKPLIFILLLLYPVLGNAQTNRETGKKGKDESTQPAQGDVVIIRENQQLILTETSYSFRKLIMEDRAKLILNNPSTRILIDSVYFGKYCVIEGQGKHGKNGRKGPNGPDYGKAPQGGEGGFGQHGGNGADLQLAMNVIEQASPLRLQLNGGNGGNGGWITARCGATITGPKGGNGGNGGRGGRGGQLKILAKSTFDGNIYHLINKKGKPGKPGLGGYPGRINKVSCPPKSPAKIVQGKQGDNGQVMTLINMSFGSQMENMNFPVPPPPPSDRINIPLIADKFATLEELDAVLNTALRESGYDGQLSYLNYPGGYALVTRIERIHQNGTAIEIGRFNPAPEFVTEFSLRALIRAFLNPTKGYFRLIAFIVTDESVGNSQENISREDALAWFTGVSNLPADIGRKPIKPDLQVEALIYEFSVSENGHEPVKVDPIRLTAKEHLLRATIWDRLNRR